MKHLTALGAVALLATSSLLMSSLATAHEDGGVQIRSQTVQFADIDTRNAHDVAKLFYRIRHAAEGVCGDRGLAARPDLSSQHSRCVDRALANAVDDIDRPTLTAYANARGIPVQASAGTPPHRSAKQASGLWLGCFQRFHGELAGVRQRVAGSSPFLSRPRHSQAKPLIYKRSSRPIHETTRLLEWFHPRFKTPILGSWKLLIVRWIVVHGECVAARTGKPSLTKKPTEERTMPKFVIEREIPGAGKMSPADLKMVSRKSCGVLSSLGPNVQWVQSYVTADKIYCIYYATDESLVRRHAELGGFPANKISTIATVIDPSTSE
jgi:UrcA family protein